MIMRLCDHDTVTITDIVVDNKYVLIYCGSTLIVGCLVTGNVTSLHSVEVFDTVQELIDRGVELGLQSTSIDYLIRALEHGGVLPVDHMDYLHSVVWEADIGFQDRMTALGYERSAYRI